MILARRDPAIFLVILWASSPGVARSQPPATTKATSATSPIDTLRHRLLRLARLRHGRQGIAVSDERGEMLFQWRARRRFNPASNVKVLAVAASLWILGVDHRFRTEVLGRVREGYVDGPLILRGGGDPSLSLVGLRRLVGLLRARGIRRVRGPIIVDVSAFASRRAPPGFAEFRSDGPFRAPPGALTLAASVFQVTVAPGVEVGDRAIVTIQPPVPYLALRERVYTSRRRTRLRLRAYRRGSLQTGVLIRGRVTHGASPRRFWRRVYHPALYAGSAFLSALEAGGIVVERGRVRRGRGRRGLPLLASLASAPLGRILRRTLKHSINISAELLLLAAGQRLFGGAATYGKARRVLQRYLLSIGIGHDNFRLPNGSGLSRQARLSPEAMVRALRAIREDFVVGPELIAALPLLGVDGTLTAFRRSAARGQVRAKTGTLAGATCLSGYVMVQGRGLYFSFMGARIRHLYRLRRRHVAMIEALRRYLKTLGGRAAPRLDTPSRSDPRDPHSLQTGRR